MYAQANMHRVGGGHGGELQTVVSTAGSGYELEPSTGFLTLSILHRTESRYMLTCSYWDGTRLYKTV